jgi:hypothetical protein
MGDYSRARAEDWRLRGWPAYRTNPIGRAPNEATCPPVRRRRLPVRRIAKQTQFVCKAHKTKTLHFLERAPIRLSFSLRPPNHKTNLHERRLEAGAPPRMKMRRPASVPDIRKTNPLLRQARKSKGVALAGAHRAGVRRPDIFGRTQKPSAGRQTKPRAHPSGVAVSLLAELQNKPNLSARQAKQMHCTSWSARRQTQFSLRPSNYKTKAIRRAATQGRQTNPFRLAMRRDTLKPPCP